MHQMDSIWVLILPPVPIRPFSIPVQPLALPDTRFDQSAAHFTVKFQTQGFPSPATPLITAPEVPEGTLEAPLWSSFSLLGAPGPCYSREINATPTYTC